MICPSCLILVFSWLCIMLYCFLLGMSHFVVYYNFVFCVLLFWFSCQYLRSDWLERLLWGHIFESRRLSPRRPCQKVLVCTFRFSVLFYCVFVSSRAQYISYCCGIMGNIACLCWKCHWTRTNWLLWNGLEWTLPMPVTLALCINDWTIGIRSIERQTVGIVR